jgi:hypothetical protein
VRVAHFAGCRAASGAADGVADRGGDEAAPRRRIIAVTHAAAPQAASSTPRAASQHIALRRITAHRSTPRIAHRSTPHIAARRASRIARNLPWAVCGERMPLITGIFR